PGKFKVVVQKPASGITYDLADSTYSIEREALDPIGAEIVEVAAKTEGADTVAVDAPTEAGIVVTNVPDVFIDEVADHTLAMFLAAHRRLRLMHELTTQGKWSEGRPYFKEIPRLYGQTFALISFGNVAKAVARRCHAFGLRVIAYDPYLAELEMTAVGVEPVTSLIELCERGDFVSMHAPLNTAEHPMMRIAPFRAT